jgi:hypothetical protein
MRPICSVRSEGFVLQILSEVMPVYGVNNYKSKKQSIPMALFDLDRPCSSSGF